MSSLNTGDTITQMDIADAAGVTEVTIRNRFKERSKKAITVKLEYTKIC
jgi:transcription initiation factor TFIIIB Brf1 subunit/transcription initiation factor TFIIB